MSAKFKNGITIDGGNIDTASGQVYKINGTTVLSSTQVLGKGFSTTAGDIATIDAIQTLTNKSFPTLEINGSISGSAFLAAPAVAGGTAYIPNATGYIAMSSSSSDTVKFTPSTSTTVTLPTGATSTLARTDAGQTFTGSQVIQAAATQDSVTIAGRAGGTSSYGVTITPTTLTASRTLTVPNVDGIVVTTGDTGSVNSTMIADATIAPGDMSIGTATTSGNTPSATAADKIVSAGTSASGNTITTTNKALDFYSNVFWNQRTGDNCTIPRHIAATSFTATASGSVYGCRLYCITGGTKTWSYRFATTAAGSGIVLRVGVWNGSTGAIIAQSADITSVSTSAINSGSFSSSFTLTAGTQYYFGIGVRWSTTAPTIQGISGNAILNSIIGADSGQALSWAATGWTVAASTLPTLNFANSQGFLPWIEVY
jgi:hypothetical protein